MIKRIALLILLIPASLLSAPLYDNGIDPDVLVERILSVHTAQWEQIKDLQFDAELVEGEREDDGSFKEKVRFTKHISLKYLPDTALFYEKYLEYYKGDESQSEKDLQDQEKERKEGNQQKEAADPHRRAWGFEQNKTQKLLSPEPDFT